MCETESAPNSRERRTRPGEQGPEDEAMMAVENIETESEALHPLELSRRGHAKPELLLDDPRRTRTMTIREIEAACDASQPLDFTRPKREAPELTLKGMFYPLGFPAEVRTNSPEVLKLAAEIWCDFEKLFDTEPVRIDVHVTEGGSTECGSTECPPMPVYRFFMPLFMAVADAENYSICDLEQNWTRMLLTSEALRHKLYARTLFLAAAPGPHLVVRHITPIHAGCVALDGRGVLLCGDSGAGKSTLSYACARAGWTYISDDGSFLMNFGRERVVMGDCHKVRFRPTAVELFPEIEGHAITPRLVGKPSIELPTSLFPRMKCARTAQVDFIVFLNRTSGGPPELLPYRKDVARHSMRQTLYGTQKSLAVGYPVIERLLTADVLELRYTDLDWAIDRLQSLVREGR